MTNYTRKNAWDANNGGQFQDSTNKYTDLYWYAKAVQILQSRPINDPTSWWFYAAIHGQFLLNPIKDPKYLYLNWINISYIGTVADLNNLPLKSQTNLFWNQCQHGTWYFGAWHRGYLVALENLIREVIISQLGGPEDWALPYWNYLNQSTQYQEFDIPPAFIFKSLPDGSPNPLLVPERYGPNGNGNIFIQVGNGQNDANDNCQYDLIYSDPSAPGRRGSGNINGYYYGGEETGFSHSNGGFGDLEMNPHNFVHGMVGGEKSSNGQMGLMGVPATAALDPVFFLHHANIDRMWAAWNQTGNNANPTDVNWLNGPTANGNSRFAMPVDSNGTPWYYTPGDVIGTTNINYDGSLYSYTYDDLSLTSYAITAPSQPQGNIRKRLSKLGVTNLTETNIQMANKNKNELIGASSGAHLLENQTLKTNIKMSSNKWKSVSESLKLAAVDKQPDEIYLQLEDVKGTQDTNFLSVFINGRFVNSISLFGLHQASLEGDSHGGGGITYTLNITDQIDDLHLNEALGVETLEVEVRTKNESARHGGITIGRIGIYRSGK